MNGTLKPMTQEATCDLVSIRSHQENCTASGAATPNSSSDGQSVQLSLARSTAAAVVLVPKSVQPNFAPTKSPTLYTADRPKISESQPVETSLRVIWEFWRAGYERSYHGEPGVVELGEIG
jgi:hypothetical protein